MKKKKTLSISSSQERLGAGRTQHPGHQPSPCEAGNPEYIPSSSSCPASNTLTQTKRATFQAQSNLNPLPTGMLFLARDLPKEATSAKPLPCEVRGKLRQLSSSAPALRSKQGIYRRLGINLSPFLNSPTASARSNRV